LQELLRGSLAGIKRTYFVREGERMGTGNWEGKWRRG